MMAMLTEAELSAPAPAAKQPASTPGAPESEKAPAKEK
jgi:hypothetical protein